MNPSPIGHFFEDFKAGDIIRHSASKTIFESDNNLFSLLTMNHHPLHTNRDFAEKSQHGQILVVGTLVFSIVVGMTVPDISGKAIANLEYEKVEHLGPVFINDTIYAQTEIMRLGAASVLSLFLIIIVIVIFGLMRAFLGEPVTRIRVGS